MEIKRVEDWRLHTDLLLDADPDMDMLQKYINDGDIFGLYEDGELLCIAVTTAHERGYELKNIATRTGHRGKGFAGHMIEHLCKEYAGRGSMMVGTADNGVGFYLRNGFSVSHRVLGFFTDNYPEPIFDNGQQCVDMIYLSREL